MLTPQEILDLCCERFHKEDLTISTSTATSDSKSTQSIPRTLTCCLISIVDSEIDAVNGQIHPIYKITDDKKLWGVNEEEEDWGVNSTGRNQSGDLDFSKIPFINDIWNVKAEWEVSVKMVAVIPLVILAIVGNLAVIRVLVKARLTRNPVNSFILNMSIADLLTSLIFPWIFLVSDFYQKYVLGSFICKFEVTILSTLMLTSVLSLTVISYDRLTAILFPFKNRMMPKCAKIIIYCIWILALVVSAPMSYWRTYKERQWKDFLEQYCKEDTFALKYWVGIIVLLVYIPLSALTLSYTAIVIKLDTLEKRQRDHPIKQVKYKSKVVRMFFVVVIIFCLCWIPYTAFIFIRLSIATNSTEVTEGFQNLFFISHYLVYVNGALNPIIYGLKNDNLRREFRTALPTCLKRKKRIHISTIDRQDGQPGEDGKKQMDFKNVQFQNENKLTRWMKTSETYDCKSLFSSKEKGTASLNSFERRNSALEDLGLPVPKALPHIENDWRMQN